MQLHDVLSLPGVISYYREGCTPMEYVDSLFLDAKEAIRNKNIREKFA